MADSVLLSGAGARIEFAPGAANIDLGPITMICVVKATAAGVYQSLMVGQTVFYRLLFTDVNEISVEDGASGNLGGPTITTTNWNLVGFTHTNASDQPHYHHYDGTTWQHITPGGAAIGVASAATSQDISESGGDAFAGNILISGIVDSVMSDSAIEALANGYAAWKAAGFKEGVRFNAVTGLASYVPGGTMSQGTTVGASLDTGDVPSWWNDSLGAPAVSPNYSNFPRYLRAGRSTV